MLIFIFRKKYYFPESLLFSLNYIVLFFQTFLTSISLSAIATNGVVSGGGPYYMVAIEN